MNNQIKTLRKKHKMTQEDLGKKLGVTKATVQKYENGTIKNLKRHTIAQLSSIFNVHPTVFLPNKEESLKREVVIFDEIKLFYGDEVVEHIGGYISLPEEGRDKVNTYIDDMIKIYGDGSE